MESDDDRLRRLRRQMVAFEIVLWMIFVLIAGNVIVGFIDG